MDLREVGRGGEGHTLNRYGSRQEQAAGSCECGNEPSGSTKCEQFLEQLKTC